MDKRFGLRVALVAAALAMFTSGLASAEPKELKFGHVGAPGSLFATSAEEFAKRANEKLGDKYKVVVYGSSQLGGDKELLQKVKLGTVDFALPSTVMSSVVPEFGLFELPYLVQDRDHMKEITTQVVEPSLMPLAEKQGYKIIGVWENGFRQITNNQRPIERPEDLKGLKLRTPKGKWRVKMFQAYGANPSPMALSEVFVALQTGVMDGQENPLVQIYSQKFQEVQKYLSLSGHVYTPAYVVVSTRKWGRLPDDVREVLEQTASQMTAFVYETAEALDADLVAKFEEAGVEVNEADKPAFIEASEAIYAEFAKEVSAAEEMIATAQKVAPVAAR